MSGCEHSDRCLDRARVEAHYFSRRRKMSAQRLRQFSEIYFGEHGGYAQQYLFHHARMGSRKSTARTECRALPDALRVDAGRRAVLCPPRAPTHAAKLSGPGPEIMFQALKSFYAPECFFTKRSLLHGRRLTLSLPSRAIPTGCGITTECATIFWALLAAILIHLLVAFLLAASAGFLARAPGAGETG